jgi:arginine decarboxylase
MVNNIQNRTPLFDAVRKYVDQGTIPFHVPGHKQGRGLAEFKEFVGENVLAIDLTCFDGTDNICKPLDVIAEAQDLAAKAYGADHAYFLVNGTTSGIQAMIMSVCQAGDKIIVPRNAHKSILGGIILSGAIPIYVQPEINDYLGVAVGVTPEVIAKALQQHPDAKAVFVINPTYYGFAPNL